MKIIETEYKGYKFRSRLEARWAVFFDALGLKWEYEPEGFDLGNGLYYLPDFKLHDIATRYGYEGEGIKDIYVEVKGVPNENDAKKIAAFKHPIWVVGDIPDPGRYVSDCERQHDEYCEKYKFENRCALCPYQYGSLDGDICFRFSLGSCCNTLSFHGHDSSYSYGYHDSEIESAFKKARQARFEHDETPE